MNRLEYYLQHQGPLSSHACHESNLITRIRIRIIITRRRRRRRRSRRRRIRIIIIIIIIIIIRIRIIHHEAFVRKNTNGNYYV